MDSQCSGFLPFGITIQSAEQTSGHYNKERNCAGDKTRLFAETGHENIIQTNVCAREQSRTPNDQATPKKLFQ